MIIIIIIYNFSKTIKVNIKVTRKKEMITNLRSS